MTVDRGSCIRRPCQRLRRSVAATERPLRDEIPEMRAEYVGRRSGPCKGDASLRPAVDQPLEVA